MDEPMVPIFTRGLTPPLPKASRSVALGRRVGEVLRELPGDERVALVASGVFSLDVGSPRIGTVDREWTAHVLDRILNAQIDALAHEATTQRMLAAGSVAGEMINWLAVLGAMGDRVRSVSPTYAQVQEGHAFLFWDLEAV
jgi:hypothetical protein